MQRFYPPHPGEGRHRARRGRRADRPGTARLGQGLGAGRAMEAGEGRQAINAALEVLRAGRRRRLREDDRRLQEGDRRQGRSSPRIVRGRAAEGFGRRQHRRRASTWSGASIRCRTCSRRSASTSPTSPTTSARSTAAGSPAPRCTARRGNKWIGIPVCYHRRLMNYRISLDGEGRLQGIPEGHRRASSNSPRR